MDQVAIKQEQDEKQRLGNRPTRLSKMGDFSMTFRHICYHCGKGPSDGGRQPYRFHTSQFPKLTEHLKEYHPKEPFKYLRTICLKCYTCNLTFSLNDFRKHMLSVHMGRFTAIININLCDLCNDLSNFRDKMVDHVRTVHLSADPESNVISQVVCLLCGAKYEYGHPDIEKHSCEKVLLGTELDSIPLVDLVDCDVTEPLRELASPVHAEESNIPVPAEAPSEIKKCKDLPLVEETENAENSAPPAEDHTPPVEDRTPPAMDRTPEEILPKAGTSGEQRKDKDKRRVKSKVQDAAGPSQKRSLESEPTTSAQPVEKRPLKKFTCGEECCGFVTFGPAKTREHLFDAHFPKHCGVCQVVFRGPVDISIHKAVFRKHADHIKPLIDEEKLQVMMGRTYEEASDTEEPKKKKKKKKKSSSKDKEEDSRRSEEPKKAKWESVCKPSFGDSPKMVFRRASQD